MDQIFLPKSQRRDVRPEDAPWTHANELRLHQAFVEGLGNPLVMLEAITIEMFRSPSAICQRLKHMGLIVESREVRGYDVTIGRYLWLTYKDINVLARKYK